MAENRGHERYQIPHADVLLGDTWAEESYCPHCGLTLHCDAMQCPACRQWIGECGASCPECPSPRCVGGKRQPEARG